MRIYAPEACVARYPVAVRPAAPICVAAVQFHRDRSLSLGTFLVVLAQSLRPDCNQTLLSERMRIADIGTDLAGNSASVIV
jgi:hypothetical protein